MLVHTLLRRLVVMSGGHCTLPTGDPTIRLKSKKTDEAQSGHTHQAKSALSVNGHSLILPDECGRSWPYETEL